VSTQKAWYSVKVSRATIKSGGETIAGPAFGASWPVRLGRVDAAEAAPGGRVPLPTAPVAEIKAYMAALGTKPGTDTTSFFAPKPTFWERPAFVLWTGAADEPAAEEARFLAEDPAFKGYKENYDRSRKTVTRTDYEVDFIDYFTTLASLGATFKKDAYLHPETVIAVF
ncbi:Thylakoid lumenal protein, chloroplastic, partial [Tetrabaena socialis]